MASTDVDLEPQLKDVGKQLSHPLDSNDELLLVLDRLEKLLLKVDQSPKKSMLEALRPSINALIRDSLLKHSDMDVKVSVASCISEITRITAPDAPYTDDQMRDVFQLIVSSFEDLADRSSRSYHKRASILETVSKVRSCVIMLDLECDELIVKMFEHFLKSVRDYHLDGIYSSMENIMVLVIEESEEISVELLKPLLASVKKDRVGVLPIAHKLGKEVLLKSADKLKPYMKPALISLDESLDKYHKVVAAVCEGTTANFDDNDAEDNNADQAAMTPLACKPEKDSLNEAQQADESKATPAASDHADQVVKAEMSPKEEVEVDSTVESKSPKSVMSNGVNVTVNEPEAEEAPVDQESKKLEEDKSEEAVKKEDTADSDPDKAAEEVSQTEKEPDTVISSVEPSDSSNVDGDKEVEKDNDVKESETEKEKEKDDDVKQEDENEKDDVKDSEDKNENDNVKESENQNQEDKEEKDVTEIENEAVESKSANDVPDESSVESKKEPAPQEVKTASPTKSGPADNASTHEDTPESEKQEGKKAVIEKEVEVEDAVNESGDDEASDSDAKPLKRSKSKPMKQSGKKSKQSGKKGEKSKAAVEEDEGDDSDDKLLKLSARKSSLKKKDDGKKRAEKEHAKSLSEDDEMDVSPKIAVEEDDSDNKPLKQSGKKLKQSGKKGEKSKIEDDEDDSDDKPLKESAKKSTSKKKNVGKQRKDQAKSLSGDDEMDITPKSDKGEGNSTETPVTSAKRKRSTGKDEVSDTIKYDESLIGKKVKVWWPEDKMYYEGLVSEFFPAKKKHKVSYVDGDEEKLNLRTQRWEIIKEFSVRDDEEQNTEVQSDEGSPETHKKKKTKSDPAASQEKNKDSAKKSSGKTKAVNKSNVKTPTTGGKSNTNGPTKGKSDVKEPEDVKSTESGKGRSKSGNKRKKRT